MKAIIFMHTLARHDDMMPAHVPDVLNGIAKDEGPSFEEQFADLHPGCALYRGMSKVFKKPKIIMSTDRALRTIGAKNYKFIGVYKVVCPDSMFAKIRNQYEVWPDAPEDVYFVRVEG